jgi:hypothetical protein
MKKKITWSSLSDADRRVLASICPMCQTVMVEYPNMAGWQKCHSCSYARENPAESLDHQIELIEK